MDGLPKTIEVAKTEMAYNAPRQIYENNDSINNENFFAQLLRNSVPEYKIDKIPMKYHFDFACTDSKTGDIKVFIEYKHRSCTWESQIHYGGYRIGLEKWAAMCDWQEKLGVKCLFYVHFSDAEPNHFQRYVISKKELKDLRLVFWGGHKRHKDDNEPAVVLPTNNFLPVQL
ncbi:MAG: hypothetical protein CMP39_04260 [Rickettsiales bacterium]|nr:hypothetical protein [Rickettsiales bacterium]|tara:strand:+ start:312 stop:827 length:516 start_codon:yes stop_codon:yes gene_type:complete